MNPRRTSVAILAAVLTTRLEVLKRGGTAAVAAAAALGVTEPCSAGIGDGGFLVHYDA